MKGLVHIHCRDGEGKTTMVIGSAVRATGRGIRVLIARFLKADNSSEILVLAHVPGITLLPCGQDSGFSWEATPAQKQVASVYHRDNFYKAWEMAVSQDGEGGFDALVLNEIIDACNLGLVDEDLMLNLIRYRPEHMEVILTNGGSSEYMGKRSNYTTEMAMRRHPFEQGIGTREGTEY